MRCHICNKAIDTPEWNSLHEDFEPCSECQQIVDDLVSQYRDRPFIEEDSMEGTDVYDDTVLYDGLGDWLSD